MLIGAVEGKKIMLFILVGQRDPLPSGLSGWWLQSDRNIQAAGNSLK